MKKHKIFVINPPSIVGDILIRGLARGLEELGCEVISYDIREIDYKKVKEFEPDYILGLDYIHLVNDEVYEFVKSLNALIIYYFIDGPNTHFAHVGDLSLYEKLCKEDSGIVLSWDSHYLKDFKQKSFFFPVGIDTELYKPNDKEVKKSKIVFTGRPLTDRRESVIAHIVKNFPGQLDIYSYQKHFETSIVEMKEKGFLTDDEIGEYKKCYHGFLKDEKELAAVYHNCDVVLNITMEQGATSMNYRVLEVMASGAFLLTDYVEDTAKFFEEDKDFVFYRNFDELTQRLNHYLNNHQLRKEIAGNGMKKIQQAHTLKCRAKELLDIIESL